MKKRYIVTGISKDTHSTGETVYLDIDTHSGGYPYWTSSIQSARTYDTVERAVSAISGCDFMFQQAHSVKVCTLEYVCTPVQEVGPNVLKLQQTIAVERIKLAENIAQLETVSKLNDATAIVKYSTMIGECAKTISQLERQLESITN